MKKCKKCGRLKTNSQFYATNEECNECRNKNAMTDEQMREWLEANPIVRSFPTSVEEAIS